MRRLSRHGLARLVLTGAVLLVGHCVAAAQAARVGREFKIEAGRAVTLDGGGLRVRFVRVASDSRCPADVNCVWAGNAEVLFEVGARARRGRTTLTLNTNASPERPGEGRHGRYTLKLLGLAPRPRSNRKIAAGRYTATLLVVRE
ncbi:MAG TPA: hypothetical protein VF591_21480 [Pyrinomonadaceae bacterium]|jgi:hypothetical protein